MQTLTEFLTDFQAHADDPNWRALLYFDKWDQARYVLSEIALNSEGIVARKSDMLVQTPAGAILKIRAGEHVDDCQRLAGNFFQQIGFVGNHEVEARMRLAASHRTAHGQTLLPITLVARP